MKFGKVNLRWTQLTSLEVFKIVGIVMVWNNVQGFDLTVFLNRCGPSGMESASLL